MTATRKLKISVSLDADLVEAVDRQAADEGSTRSAVMERMLRQSSHRARATRLAEETAAYYEALAPAERQEDTAWATMATRASRALSIDEPSPRASSSRSRRPVRRG
jgi:metal-responsive CopG/Arc/MetJ family transcriptional regulator